MTMISPETLLGKRVSLETLNEDHRDGLVEAAGDGELWSLWYALVPRPDEMHAEILRRLAMQEAGFMVPFTTRLNDPVTGEPGKIVGMTTYCNINAELPRLEIGYSRNAASV